MKGSFARMATEQEKGVIRQKGRSKRKELSTTVFLKDLEEKTTRSLGIIKDIVVSLCYCMK